MKSHGSARSHLLTLPAELRDQIYRLVLERDKIDRISPNDLQHQLYAQGDRLALLRTCRWIRQEAEPIIYERAFFYCRFVQSEYTSHRIEMARHESGTVFDNFLSKVRNGFIDLHPDTDDFWIVENRHGFEKLLQLLDQTKFRRLYIRIHKRGHAIGTSPIPSEDVEYLLSPLRELRMSGHPSLRLVLFNWKRVNGPGLRWILPSTQFRKELGIELGDEETVWNSLDPPAINEKEFVKYYRKESAWEFTNELVAPEEAWPFV